MPPCGLLAAGRAHCRPPGEGLGMRPVASTTQRVHARWDCGKIAFEIPSMLSLLSSLLAYFFFPAFLRRCVTSPRLVWRLPVALGPRVSNDLLSVRAQPPVTRFSMRLATRAGRPMGGDPIYPTAFWQDPEVQRAASTSIRSEA